MFPDNDNEKLSGLPHSTTGSLSSIITTSIASSEPDTGFVGSGDEKICGSDGGGGGGGGDDKNVSAESRLKQEKWTTILLEVSIPFFLAGIGTIGAGIILGRVEDWDVFQHIPELYILVPALLGLKGNLDMCLASRLSTQANLGNMTSRKEIFKMIAGNISLVQVQSIVASFLVSVFAISVGFAVKTSNDFEFDHVLLIIAAAMFTATSSCFVLGEFFFLFILIFVIIFF